MWGLTVYLLETSSYFKLSFQEELPRSPLTLETAS